MDIIKILDKLFQIVYRKNAYVYMILFTLMIYVTIFVGKYINTEEIIDYKQCIVPCLTVGTMALIAFVFMWNARRMPKFRTDELGVLFIIGTSSDEGRNNLNNMFVEKIAQRFNNEDGLKSRVILLNPFRTEIFLNLNKDEKRQFIIQTNAKLVFWGMLEKGKENGKDVIALRLESAVTHDGISSEVSRMLSYNMTNMMSPIRNIRVFDDNNILEFDLVAETTELFSEYIMGEACYFSGNVSRALELFNSLQNCLKQNRRNVNYVAVLKNLTKKRIMELYTIRAAQYYYDFRKCGNKTCLDEMKKCLDLVHEYGGASSTYNEQMAIYHFCYDRDVASAQRYIKANRDAKCRSIITKYDNAFLKMYVKYTPYVAYKCWGEYENIFKRNTDLSLIEEIEGFISWVLEEEPERIELNWLLAILANEREDYYLSDKCLEKFCKGDKEINERLEKCIEVLKEKNGKQEPIV